MASGRSGNDDLDVGGWVGRSVWRSGYSRKRHMKKTLRKGKLDAQRVSWYEKKL